MLKFFGIYSHRPADYAPFMLENLDSVSSVHGWVLGRVPRVLEDEELFLFETLRLYQYTHHGISIHQNCYHVLVDNLSYVMTLRATGTTPWTTWLREQCKRCASGNKNVEQAIQDRQRYDHNQQRKTQKLQEIPHATKSQR